MLQEQTSKSYELVTCSLCLIALEEFCSANLGFSMSHFGTDDEGRLIIRST